MSRRRVTVLGARHTGSLDGLDIAHDERDGVDGGLARDEYD